MKTLKNKVTQIDKAEGGKIEYKDLIQTCLDNTPQGGFTFEEMRKRFRVQDALDKSNGNIKLEDEDVVTLKAVVKSFKWGGMHRDLLDFDEAINSL